MRLTVAPLLCLSALVVAGPAGAAFPGADGEIAFSSNRDAGAGEIYAISPSGGAATRITFPTGGNADPAFSPDGTRIAFNKGGDIHVMDADGMNPDGTGTRRVTSLAGAEGEPTWSPDGTRIAYVANSVDVDGGTDPEIWAVNADGSGRARLTDNAFPDTQPAWSPPGDKIAFVSERRTAPFNDTNSNVYVMDADGANQTNLTPNQADPIYQGHDENPDWSPTGDKIAYVHGNTPAGGGLPDIWTMDPNGANKLNVSNNNLSSDVMPAWSPAGDRIAYVGVASGTTDRNISVMNANGTGQGAIDLNPRNDIDPDWQPVPSCTLTVNAANDPLAGTAGKDVLCGDERANTITGADGNDIVRGAGGADRLSGGPGNDTLDGATGTDTVLYSGPAAVTANLTTGFATGQGADVLLGVENLSGSGANDRLTGSAVPNTLVGGAGGDVLLGLAGNDALNSRDRVNRNDTLDGGPGRDTCTTDATEKAVRNCP